MAFDPNFPPDHQALTAAPYRNQYKALKALIDAQQATINSQQAAITSLQAQTQAQTQEIADVQDVVNALQSRCPA